MRKITCLFTVLFCLTVILSMTSCSKNSEIDFNPTIQPTQLQNVSEQTDDQEPKETSDIGQNENIENLSELDLGRYNGKWCSEDYVSETDEAGDLVFYGTEIILNMESNEVEITSASKPPANRIAYIKSQITIEASRGSFTFDDDGWGNSGKGLILFGDDEIMVKIDIINHEDSNWRIFSGEKIFYSCK